VKRIPPINLVPYAFLRHHEILRMSETYYDRHHGKERRALVQSWGFIGGTNIENKAALALTAYVGGYLEIAEQVRVGPYRADFAIPGIRALIEVDGFVHGSSEQKRRDRKKDDLYQDRGWHCYRIDCVKDESAARIGQKVSEIIDRAIQGFDDLSQLRSHMKRTVDDEKLMLDAQRACSFRFFDQAQTTTTGETR